MTEQRQDTLQHLNIGIGTYAENVKPLEIPASRKGARTMDRLTNEELTHACNDPWDYCGLDGMCQRDCFKPKPCKIPAMLHNLAVYKNTGLTPEDCAAYAKAEAEQRVVVFENKEHADRIRELAEADKDGRIWIDPCKVGQELFRISGREIERCVYLGVQKYRGASDGNPTLYLKIPPIEHPFVCLNGLTGERLCEGKEYESLIQVSADEIGKTLFLDYKSAKKALKKKEWKRHLKKIGGKK